MPHQALRQLRDHGEEWRPQLGLLGWNDVENVDERHGGPAEPARPDEARAAGLRVRPALLLGLVPGVVVETGARVAQVGARDGELAYRLLDLAVVACRDADAGEERHAHVDAVEPELVGIALLVPEGALRGPRMLGELGRQRSDGRLVPRVGVPRLQ